jgi:hypothetical protein
MRTGRRLAAGSQSSQVEEMTMDYRRISEPDPVAQARTLLAGSHEPEAAEAAALDAAMVCREAEILLRYIRSGWATGPGEKNFATRVGFEAARLG